MGTIAEKLTYLNTTKEKIRDSINLTGANIGTSDTFRSYASKLKKGYIDIINNGIDTLYNNFPKVSGIGSNLSLTPTYEAPMKLNEIQGDTLQDGTPTPNTPVEIQSVTGLQNVNVCGKNLFNKDSGFINAYIDTSGVIHNNINSNALFTYIKVQSNTTYTFSCNTSLRNLGINEFNSSKTFISRTQSQNVGSLTITTSSTTNYLRLQINYDNTTSITQAIIDSLNLQLEKGSATTYEPYNGNTYEVNLGKNLLDYQTTFATPTNSTADNDGWITASYDNTSGSSNAYANYYTKIPDGVKIKPNTTYYVYLEVKNVSYSGTSTGNYINVTNVNASYISQTGISLVRLTDLSNNSIYKYEITTKSDLSGISGLLRTFVGIQAGYSVSLTYRLTLSESNIDVSNFTYSPYFTPIELNKIGTYQDSIKKSTGKNLFDEEYELGTINYNTGVLEDSTTIIRTKNYQEIEPSTQYTLKVPDEVNGIILYYYNNGTYVATTQPTVPSTKVITFTTNASANQVKWRFNSNYTTLNNQTMLNEGSTALPYEPYGKVWYIEKQIGKVVLDGTEDWTLNNNYTNNSRFTNNDDILNKSERNVLSNYFVKGTGGTDTTNIDVNGVRGKIMLTIPNSIATSVSNLTTWLSTHNTEVLYVLVTPEYTEITNTELIEDLETLYTAKSQEGTTNISITSEDLEMILNVSTLKGEV